jgi:hypothetical protein
MADAIFAFAYAAIAIFATIVFCAVLMPLRDAAAIAYGLA